MISFIKNNLIKNILVGVAVISAAVATFNYNRSAYGLCVGPMHRSDPKYYPDMDYIRMAMNGRIKWQELSRQHPYSDYVGNYLKYYPECCKVFRKKDWSERNIRNASAWIWHNNVIVRIYSDKLMHILKTGKQPSEMEEFNQVIYEMVDNCFYGSESMANITPGG